MTRHGSWNGLGTVHGNRETETATACKPSCCKTPFGHSAAATNCVCHINEKENR